MGDAHFFIGMLSLKAVPGMALGTAMQTVLFWQCSGHPHKVLETYQVYHILSIIII